MARRRRPTPPASDQYRLAEAAGQQTFDGIEPLDPMERRAPRAVPLLNTAALDAKLVEEPEQLQLEALPTPTTTEPSKPAPLVGPADLEAPQLPFRPSDMDVQYLTGGQLSTIVLLYLVAAGIFAIAVFGATVAEIGSGVKIVGLSRDMLLGFLGIGAIGLSALTILAAAPLARRMAPNTSPLRHARRRLTRFLVTFLILLLPLVAVYQVRKHVYFVLKSIVVVTMNDFRIGDFDTTTEAEKRR
jgi:hypothetical protein